MNGFHQAKVIVTGARGFIGTHLTRRLLREGAEVHAVTRRPAGRESERLYWWQGELSEIDTARKLVSEIQPSVIFHVAGVARGAPDLKLVPATFRDNLQTTVNLLVAATESNTHRLILPGSLEEPDETDAMPLAGSPYAASKWSCSVYARTFHALYNTQAVIARIFMAYGPEQPDAGKLIPYVIRSFLKGEPPQLSVAERLIDWIFIEDAVDGLLAVAQTPGVAGTRIDLGSGTGVSIRSVVDRIRKITESETDARFGLMSRPIERQPVADLEKTKRVCGWSPAMTLDDGLRRTVEWYREQIRNGVI